MLVLSVGHPLRSSIHFEIDGVSLSHLVVQFEMDCVDRRVCLVDPLKH
jgi:hypothetical protein